MRKNARIADNLGTPSMNVVILLGHVSPRNYNARAGGFTLDAGPTSPTDSFRGSSDDTTTGIPPAVWRGVAWRGVAWRENTTLNAQQRN